MNHHRLLLTLIFLALTIGNARAQNLLNAPETVVWDSTNSRYLVSNMNSGDIIEIDRFGSYSIFSDVLTSTYGMAISGNTLFVSSYTGPTAGLVGFDLTTREIVYQRPTTTFGENGITADTSGNIYVSDTGGNRVIGIRTSDGYAFNVAAVSLPNAIMFDARNNRLLVTSNVWWTPVYAVSLPGGAVSTVTSLTGQFSGLAEDALHNLYIAFFNHGTIYRLDSTLSGTPPPFSSAHNGPEGICFNKLHSTLVVPNLMGSWIDFMPQDIDVWMHSDFDFGTTPLEVGFDGQSILEIDQWIWDFGDGDTAYGSTPTHTYTAPGFYDVTVCGITADNDTCRRVYPGHMTCLADSLRVEVALLDEPGPLPKFEITIRARNHAPLGQMIIPVEYSGDLNLAFDSYELVGCRTEHFDQVAIVDQDGTSKRMTFELTPRVAGSPLFLEPGEGEVLKLYFYLLGGTTEQTTTIDLDGYETAYRPMFLTDERGYNPVPTPGLVEIPCCSGQVGDVNGDGGSEPTIGDISALIDVLFINADPGIISCLKEADVNQSGGDNPRVEDLTIGDVSYLIDYLFVTGASLGLPGCL
jgi:hypothetical protein